ncbi:putative disease resistance protein At1g50180 isoform X3 [Olea europaea var. sylvestris]|uniref:putative disease resistance protein At1g50180 isoform X3 n=1 Tax=Olea europaea var. sylvestris TaxID=158386 RepID=UPI000C1CD99A|nr:putative disease resistance protein At1g50180 isoform X3 [Olea europaea var. sylvestris]
MSRDNWERLVVAVLRKEKDREIARGPSLDPSDVSSRLSSISISSDLSSTFNFSSPAHEHVPVSPAQGTSISPPREHVPISPPQVINQAVERRTNLIVGSRFYRLKEDMERIERQMSYFKSCLKDAESKQGGSHEVANSIIDTRDLLLDFEDILDTYIQSESHKGKGPFRFVKHTARILCFGGITNTFSQKIEEIKRRAQEIKATRERYRIILDAYEGDADLEVWNRRQEFLVATESMVVGREDKFQELEEKLRSSNPECKMICVVGEAGVGKTTVAKTIYKEMRNEFTSSALVYVSNEPRLQELLLEIAKQVGLENEKMNENLEVNLRSLLNENRCLIFLDDIWKNETWDELINVIPINSRNCSRIIITSRYTHVGRYIGGESSLIELDLLDQEKSWELFSESMKSSSENMSEISSSRIGRYR